MNQRRMSNWRRLLYGFRFRTDETAAAETLAATPMPLYLPEEGKSPTRLCRLTFASHSFDR